MKKSGKINGNNKKRTFKINSKATIKELVNFDNNTNVKVSIIVPICNVEKFLKKCLDSIEVQTLKDIDSSAFYGCRSLTTIGLPSSILSFGDSVAHAPEFFGCAADGLDEAEFLHVAW